MSAILDDMNYKNGIFWPKMSTLRRRKDVSKFLEVNIIKNDNTYKRDIFMSKMSSLTRH